LGAIRSLYAEGKLTKIRLLQSLEQLRASEEGPKKDSHAQGS
jgi:hypothetical protein